MDLLYFHPVYRGMFDLQISMLVLWNRPLVKGGLWGADSQGNGVLWLSIPDYSLLGH
jgi:hypothetical protein